jgi:site-specific recombinase XerD
MIKDIFIRATIVTRLETGPLGSHLDALATVLQDQRYTTSTISIHLREAHAFGCWLAENHHHLSEISEATLEHYLNVRSTHPESLSRKRRKKISAAINTLLRHLRNVSVIPPQPAENLLETEARQWLIRYREHLEKVLGLAPTTRQKYLFFATRLLNSMNHHGVIEWSAFTADRIIEFVRTDAAPRKGFGPHGTATAVRSLLRFLVSQGRLSGGVETAIPTIRRYSHAALPQRLNEADISRLFTVCADATAIGKRNYAMLVLLSRLGLRAKEVVGMQLNDIDWVNGSLLVRSTKTHSQRVLPLARDVGEALVDYLQHGRPTTNSRNVFLTHRAPFVPLKGASAVTGIVKRLLAKADIERRSSGAHLFRHTAATQMVNRGVSFKEIADVLGHQKLQTTTIYAKLDLAALSKVALPWPGGAQ